MITSSGIVTLQKREALIGSTRAGGLGCFGRNICIRVRLLNAPQLMIMVIMEGSVVLKWILPIVTHLGILEGMGWEASK